MISLQKDASLALNPFDGAGGLGIKAVVKTNIVVQPIVGMVGQV